MPRARKPRNQPALEKRFHSQRAIIPVSGFQEWTGEKGHKQCYNIHPVHSAIAFAGLYELWDFQGEIVPSFTIITLPPHPRFSHIHPKSIPLMLPKEDFYMWLDPDLTNTDPLQHLLKTRIREPLLVETAGIAPDAAAFQSTTQKHNAVGTLLTPCVDQ